MRDDSFLYDRRKKGSHQQSVDDKYEQFILKDSLVFAATKSSVITRLLDNTMASKSSLVWYNVSAPFKGGLDTDFRLNISL